MSSRITSGLSFFASSIAFGPSLAVITTYPALANARSVAIRKNLLSSSRRIFVMRPAARDVSHASSFVSSIGRIAQQNRTLDE